MLWFIEAARPSIHLREYFTYQVLPLETVYAVQSEGIISSTGYRPSKRTKLLKYEKLLDSKYIKMPRALASSEIKLNAIVDNPDIPIEQKRYILEASIEYLEYSFGQNDMTKDDFLSLFHDITTARATLGVGEKLDIKTPNNPIDSHRSIRITTGAGFREGEAIGFLGIRPAYHDLEDSNFGLLRGTQIEFGDIELSYSDEKLRIEELTVLSIVSLAQRSEFVDSFSWRMKIGFDRNYIDDDTNFIATLGAGFSWGNELAFIYATIDPLVYKADNFTAAVGGSIGVVIDKYSYMSTNLETTKRYYDSGDEQLIINASQNFRLSQNTQLKFKYDYIGRVTINAEDEEQTYKMMLNYYF